MLKYVKDHGNWFRHFEDISRRCEPSNVVAYFSDRPCVLKLEQFLTEMGSMFHCLTPAARSARRSIVKLLLRKLSSTRNV